MQENSEELKNMHCKIERILKNSASLREFNKFERNSNNSNLA